MGEQITYKDIIAARESLENMDVYSIEDAVTVIPNKMLFQACNHDEWQDRKIKAQQATIDALMLEYCPDEMTEEQMDEWAKHQVSE